MQLSGLLVLSAAALAAVGGGPAAVGAATLVGFGRAQSPVDKVVELLAGLKGRVVSDGVEESRSYDRSACWCEDTAARKAGDINRAKEQLKASQELILKLGAETATHEAEVAQLTKDIAANLASQREAAEARDTSHSDYMDLKTEAEQSSGALEMAIKILTGAGEGKQGHFLEASMHEAELLSAAAGVRAVLSRPSASRRLSTADLSAAEHFAARPEDFAAEAPARAARAARGALKSGASDLQVANNPFGDYAPRSTQIQGILKGLYDSFLSSLERSNAEEAEEQKAHVGLMATKQAEMATLKAALAKHSLDAADKNHALAEEKQLREDTEAALRADEAFFAETKEACAARAREWSERLRLRAEELQGLATAIEILSAPAARSIFDSATYSLLQVEATTPVRATTSAGSAGSAGAAAAERLTGAAAAARRFGGKAATVLLGLAAEVKSGGPSHFDQVVLSIGSMIEELRREEQDDLTHRDRCQGSTKENSNDMEDLTHAIGKSNSSIERMRDERENIDVLITGYDEKMAATKRDLELTLGMRNKESSDFTQGLSDDQAAIDLLNKALEVLGSFYKRHKIPLALAQQAPVYTVDENKMPETAWSDPYAGRKDDSTPIFSMIQAIKEDLEKELITAREDEDAMQVAYERARELLHTELAADKAARVEAEVEMADLDAKIEETSSLRERRQADLRSEEELKIDLYHDCSWVDTHFESRASARKSEMAGLVEAKDFLAGAGSAEAEA